jgi:hypothetical protein
LRIVFGNRASSHFGRSPPQIIGGICKKKKKKKKKKKTKFYRKYVKFVDKRCFLFTSRAIVSPNGGSRMNKNHNVTPNPKLSAKTSFRNRMFFSKKCYMSAAKLYRCAFKGVGVSFGYNSGAIYD